MKYIYIAKYKGVFLPTISTSTFNGENFNEKEIIKNPPYYFPISFVSCILKNYFC